MQIKLIVGLGNPGEKYANTRHNVGFIFVDSMAGSLKAPDFKFNKKLNSEISEVGLQKSPEVGLRIARPQTFMNKSGVAVSALSKFYKIKPENILIVHDDIDILWGSHKLSFDRSSAGHKGVESIIKALKTKNFWRLRIGIQPQTVKSEKLKVKKIKADKIILKKFTPAELKILNQTIKKAIAELE